MSRSPTRVCIVGVIGPTDPLPSGLIGIGRVVRRGFDLPERPWDLSARRWTCVGAVATEADASTSLLAVTRGVDLLITVEIGGERRRRYLDDLERSADVRHGPCVPFDPGSEHALLLDALADGSTLGEAAVVACLSRRTAARRMAEIRSHFDVMTTAEAVVCWISSRDGLHPGS